jgi:hypothetical protein
MNNVTVSVATAATFLWPGMVLAISFLEAPLKFRAHGVDLLIGLAIVVDPDRGCEVWVCLDQAACSARYQQDRVLGMARAELHLLGLGNVYPLRPRC